MFVCNVKLLNYLIFSYRDFQQSAIPSSFEIQEALRQIPNLDRMYGDSIMYNCHLNALIEI